MRDGVVKWASSHPWDGVVNIARREGYIATGVIRRGVIYLENPERPEMEGTIRAERNTGILAVGDISKAACRMST